MTFTIKLADAPTTEALARESTRTGWRELELRTRFTDGSGPATLIGLGPPANGVITVAADPAMLSKLELIAVRQSGPHYDPIEWRPEQPMALTDGMTLPPIPERLRISAWTPPAALLAKGGGGNAAFDADGNLVLDPRITASPCTGLDDVSLISTVFLTGKILNATPVIEIDFADDFPSPELNAIIRSGKRPLDEVRAGFLRTIISTFHAKRVQVFAGFYVDTGNTRTLGSSETQENITKAHAARLIALCDQTSLPAADFAAALSAFFDKWDLDIDGIWFDFEVAAFPRALSAADEPRLRELIYEVARGFGRRGRHVAFASAHDQSAYGAGTGSSPPGPPAMLGHFFSHPSSLARMPNVITRPMSYSSARFNTAKQCYGHYDVLPQGLQIAIGLGNGSANVNSDMISAAPAMRAHRCGMIHWAFQGSGNLKAYQDTDAVMNAGAPPHGTFGQPIQGPLNRERLVAMRTAGADVTIPDDAP